MILVPLDDESPVVLNKAVIFFGRSQECDVVLAHSRKVSRKHCCIAQIDDSYVIRDLGSTNGVRINEERADPELSINIGDEVWIGDIGFRLETAGQQAQPKPANRSVDTSRKHSSKRPRPSANGPVPIPEEGQDLIIEESIQQKILENDEIQTFE